MVDGPATIGTVIKADGSSADDLLVDGGTIVDVNDISPGNRKIKLYDVGGCSRGCENSRDSSVVNS